MRRARLDLDGARFEGPRGTVALTPSEVDLLTYMSEHAPRTVTRTELLQVLGYATSSTSRALDRCISRLRKKIEPDPDRPMFVLTDYGVGYRLEQGLLEVPRAVGFRGRFVGREALRERLRSTLEREGLVVLVGPPGSGKSRLAFETWPDARVVDASGVRTPAQLEVLLAAETTGLRILDDAPAELWRWCRAYVRAGGRLVVVNGEDVPAALAVSVGSLSPPEAEALLVARLGRPLTPAERADLEERDLLPRLLEAMAAHAPLLEMQETPRTLPDLFESAWTRLSRADADAAAALMYLPRRFELQEARVALGLAPVVRLNRLALAGIVERIGGQFLFFESARIAFDRFADTRLKREAEDGRRRWLDWLAEEARTLQDARTPDEVERLYRRARSFVFMVDQGAATTEVLRALCRLSLIRAGLLPVAWLEAALHRRPLPPDLRISMGINRLDGNVLDRGQAAFESVIDARAPEAHLAHAAEAVRRIKCQVDQEGARLHIAAALEGLDEAVLQPCARARVRLVAARALLNLYDFEGAARVLSDARRDCDEDVFLFAAGLEMRSYALAFLGRTREADADRATAVSARATMGSLGRTPVGASYLAAANQVTGRVDEAVENARQALTVARETSQPLGPHLGVLGNALLGVGDFDGATKAFEAAEAALESSGEAYNLGVIRTALALVRAASGDLMAARAHLRAAENLIPTERARGHVAMWCLLARILDSEPPPLMPEDTRLSDWTRYLAARVRGQQAVRPAVDGPTGHVTRAIVVALARWADRLDAAENA